MIDAFFGLQKVLQGNKVLFKSGFAYDGAKRKRSTILLALEGAKKLLVGREYEEARRRGARGGSAGAGDAGESAAPSGDVCSVSIGINGSEAPKVGVQSGEAGSGELLVSWSARAWPVP